MPPLTATQKLYELLSPKTAQSQQPSSMPLLKWTLSIEGDTRSANESSKEDFRYEPGVQNPWRMKLLTVKLTAILNKLENQF